MIEKPSILVTSLGRTGTEFFARFFASIVPDATSLHEPDIFQNTGTSSKWGHYLKQVQLAGIWRMVFLKAMGKWTLVKLSDDKFSGKIGRAQAVRNLAWQRQGFVDKMPGSFYIEANIGYYGLLDVVGDVFRSFRAVYIIRDGREWVRSHYNWGEFYGKQGIRKLISHNWPCATDLPDDPYSRQWDSFSRFEKLCWAWARLNQYALDTIGDNPYAKVYLFEEIFSGNDQYTVFNELVSFVTDIPGFDTEKLGNTAGWLERKVHQSSGELPEWQGWTNDQRKKFELICGPLMEKLGYS